ncbi:MAG: hypothetical protein IPK13_04060 [Deltaproteobacteria bacterium]|nr:hypothetical protein [Deltaproteobacteria bacterium]
MEIRNYYSPHRAIAARLQAMHGHGRNHAPAAPDVRRPSFEQATLEPRKPRTAADHTPNFYEKWSAGALTVLFPGVLREMEPRRKKEVDGNEFRQAVETAVRAFTHGRRAHASPPPNVTQFVEAVLMEAALIDSKDEGTA